MERKTSIVLSTNEKETLHKAGQLLGEMCFIAEGCEECPLQSANVCQGLSGADYNAAFSRL